MWNRKTMHGYFHRGAEYKEHTQTKAVMDD